MQMPSLFHSSARASLLGLLSLCSLSAVQAAGTAPRYSVTDLGTLGGAYSSGMALSEKNTWVAGVSCLSPNPGAGCGYNRAFRVSGAGAMQDLGGFNNTWSAAQGINSAGVTTGWADRSNGPAHAFIANSAGQLLDLQSLRSGANASSGQSVAYAINESGQVAGWADADQGSHAFFSDANGALHDLGTLGGARSEARAINASAQVAGFSALANGQEHAFVSLSAGGLRDLGTLGGNNSRAYGINDAGWVTGYAQDAMGRNHAFIADATGQMLSLGSLGGPTGSSMGFDINNWGQVVGSSSNSLGPNASHAFLRTAGQMFDLNSLIAPNSGWELVQATAINDAGQITGLGWVNGQNHAFLLTLSPVPEPASLALWLLGLLALGGLHPRRARKEHRCHPM